MKKGTSRLYIKKDQQQQQWLQQCEMELYCIGILCNMGKIYYLSNKDRGLTSNGQVFLPLR